MVQVRVYNDHTEDFTEDFQGKKITIPAGGYIEMGNAAATTLLRTASPVVIDGRGRDKYPKKLRKVEDPEQKAERLDQPERYTASDGTRFRSLDGLNLHERKLTMGASKPKPRKRRSVKLEPTETENEPEAS